jgi:hypothetical protein
LVFIRELTFGVEVMVAGKALPWVADAVVPTLSQSFLSTLRYLPLPGGIIGALTAFTVPFVWPTAINLFWDENRSDGCIGDPPG